MRHIPGLYYYNPELKIWVFVPGNIPGWPLSAPYRMLAETGMHFDVSGQPACFNATGLYISVGITPQFAEEILRDFGHAPKTFAEPILRALINLLKARFEDTEAIYRAGTMSPDEAGSPAYSLCRHSGSVSTRICCKGSHTSAHD